MKIVGIIVGAVLIIFIGGWLWFDHIVSRASSPEKDRYTLEVTKESGVTEIGERLHAAGYIDAVWQWKAYIFMSGLRASLLPGSYQLSSGDSIEDIAKKISTEPAGPEEIEITFIEGWTAKEMGDVLDRAGVIDRVSFLNAVAPNDSRTVVPKTYSFLSDKPATAGLEGYLFPDTYKFFAKSTATQVLQKFLDNFDQKVTPPMRKQIFDQNRTMFEVLTLASIIEKELETDRDRALAADLFLRRISLGMPLQSDATVNYVTGKNALQPSLEDTQADSPYNTYQHLGLPPGPISNPSISAIRAVIQPEPNEYLYFLTELDKKRTHFSKTLEEHNQKKAQYLR